MKYLNEILINWNNSDFNDPGFLKASDVKKRMKPQLIYKLDTQPGQIKIFDIDFEYFDYFMDKVYINDEHIELTERGFTVNEYEPGEYYVYIDGFDKINEIGEFNFYCCDSLTSVTIPNSVTTIGNSAFWSCTGLTSITIPGSVTLIGYDAFNNCTGLTSITIPNLVKTICSSAFYNCTALTSITIPNSVTTINYYAFKNCINLKTVYIEDIDKFNKIEFEDEYSDPTYYGAKIITLKNN